jgi:hypothetical protein
MCYLNALLQNWVRAPWVLRWAIDSRQSTIGQVATAFRAAVLSLLAPGTNIIRPELMWSAIFQLIPRFQDIYTPQVQHCVVFMSFFLFLLLGMPPCNN